MDSDQLQGFIKKYSPLLICLIGMAYLLVIGQQRTASLLLAAGLAMQYFWMRSRYPRHKNGKAQLSRNTKKITVFAD